jgi:flagellar hook protein FlgE
MLTSLNSGVSALSQFQQSLDVIGNNIANVDTVGYKSANVNFADALSQTLGSNASGSEQVGTGVITASITNQFTQGSISSTGVQTNLAVNGNGFFLVKDPTASTVYATRDGDFTVDNNGYLVTSTGMCVQGLAGDIQLPTSGVESYNFGTDGTLTAEMSDGTTTACGQVELENFTSPTQLTKVGNNLYSNLTAAGPQAAAAPGSSGLGSLVVGSLEMSNVDLAGQLTDLITTQRGYEANAKVITASDQILQDMVNLGR